MKALLWVFIFSLSPPLYGSDLINWSQQQWQQTDHRATFSTRISLHKVPTENETLLSESTMILDHQYQSLILAWRLDNQLHQALGSNTLESNSGVELTEFSTSFSLLESENDFWQIGRFNMPIDPGYALRSVAFFESANNPFDDFTSTQGLDMANISLWLDDYYLTLIIALQGNSLVTEDLTQWGLVLQKDFDALSTNLIMQQYEKNALGLGATFTYVLADSWEFHGSGFARQGSVWREQFTHSVLAITDIDNLSSKAVIGTVWTSTYIQLLLEYSYQKDKLSQTEVERINAIKPQSAQQGEMYRNNLYQLYTQAYQQQYLFTQLQYSIKDHIVTANSLIGEDISALSQVKYEYLATTNFSSWLSLEIASGKCNTEFARIPWENRVQVGVQWKI